jgi:hypothetical protein
MSHIHKLALKAGSAALALKLKVINENGPMYVKIVGRKSGLISWLLTLIGIDSTFTFYVYEKRIEVTEGTLSGTLTSIYPMASLSSCGFGYLKPFHYFVLAACSLVSTIYTLILALNDNGPAGAVSVATLVMAIVFAVLYYLRKTLCIFALSHSGNGPYIFTKRSLIEGVKITEEEAGRISNIITSLVEYNQKKD